jgi:glycosyltransferase involved in cell wall biosynthesis
MKRILHVRQSKGLYGADRAMLALARATKPPLLPLVASVARPGSSEALCAEAGRLGIEAFRFDTYSRADWRGALRLAREIRARDVSLIHAHDFKTLALAVIAGLVSRVPIVATFHGDTSSAAIVAAYEAFARALGNLTAGVAAVSEPLFRTLQRWVRAAPVVYIPNGLPEVEPIDHREQLRARESLGLPPDAQVMAVIGRLSSEKGHAVLVAALRRMPIPPMVLVAGDGPLRPELEKAAKSLPIKLLGYVDEARFVYAAADAVVIPSRTEGVPLVGLEAMLLGRPVIASAVGELPYMLDGGAGVTVPPNDSAALASAMADLLRSAHAREQIAARARARARQRYSAETMAGAYAQSLYGPALA